MRNTLKAAREWLPDLDKYILRAHAFSCCMGPQSAKLLYYFVLGNRLCAGILEGLVDHGLGLLLDEPQVVFTLEAFGVNLIDIFRA